MILFPDIKNLFTIDLDGDIRAHGGAKRAAVAFLFFVDADRPVSLRVIFFSGNNMALGTGNDAQVAFFAKFFTYFYESFQNSIPKSILFP